MLYIVHIVYIFLHVTEPLPWHQERVHYVPLMGSSNIVFTMLTYYMMVRRLHAAWTMQFLLKKVNCPAAVTFSDTKSVTVQFS